MQLKYNKNAINFQVRKVIFCNFKLVIYNILMKKVVLLFLLLSCNVFGQLDSNCRTSYTVDASVIDSSLFINHYLIYKDSILEEDSYQCIYGLDSEVGSIKLQNGWGFYETAGDTFKVLYEIHVDLTDQMNRTWDTVVVNKCIVFVNPFKDVLFGSSCLLDPNQALSIKKELELNGQVRSPCSHGGFIQQYYWSGELEGSVIKVIPNGTLYEYYYKNGQVKCRGLYRNGKLFGEWLFFNEDGSLREKFVFS